MSVNLILAQDRLTWNHANSVLSGQTDLIINGCAGVRRLAEISERNMRRVWELNIA